MSTAPSAACSPAAAFTSVIVPANGDFRDSSIFIASIAPSDWPSSTLSPTATLTAWNGNGGELLEYNQRDPVWIDRANTIASQWQFRYTYTSRNTAYDVLYQVMLFPPKADGSDFGNPTGLFEQGSVGPVQVLPSPELDAEAVGARIEKRREELRGEVERAERKLSNEGFVAKAPADVVEAERNKLAAYKAELAELGG